MSRCVLIVTLTLLCFLPAALVAHEDDGPPIAITSPDIGTTFVFGAIKNHALIWNKNAKVLIAQVTFIDAQQDDGQSNEDTHEFRLPGVNFDEAKGIFFATSAKGEMIPVAHIKKILFLKSIETLPNAVVRIQHPKGIITVILEAISPNDPAMHVPAPDTNPDDTHPMDINKILN